MIGMLAVAAFAARTEGRLPATIAATERPPIQRRVSAVALLGHLPNEIQLKPYHFDSLTHADPAGLQRPDGLTPQLWWV